MAILVPLPHRTAAHSPGSAATRWPRARSISSRSGGVPGSALRGRLAPGRRAASRRACATPNPERLSSFLAAIPAHHPQAIEFRDRRWYQPAIFALLDAAGVALCLHDMRGSASPTEPVAPLVYARFHGSGARYGGAYPDRVLAEWSEPIDGWSSAGLPVWAYFNNDVGGHAVRDAARLREMVIQRAG